MPSESDSDTNDGSDDDLDSFHGIERMLNRPHISLSDCYSRDGEVDMEKYFQRRRLQILEEDWDDSELKRIHQIPCPMMRSYQRNLFEAQSKPGKTKMGN